MLAKTLAFPAIKRSLNRLFNFSSGLSKDRLRKIRSVQEKLRSMLVQTKVGAYEGKVGAGSINGPQIDRLSNKMVNQ